MSHATPFNALGGFSVGIPPELVIDENGNVVTNVNAPSSNVSANRVFANSYLYANGQPLSIGAAGANTQVQYNNAGLLGASSSFTFNSATNLLTVSKIQVGNTANLGNISNVVILGGTNGYFLQTDGAGNLTWAPATGGNGGNGTPGGANSQVQFNDAGVFGGDAGFTYNKTTNTLSVANNIAAGNSITGVNLSVSSATVYGNIAAVDIVAGNLTLGSNIVNANWIHASYFAGNAHNLFGLVGANVVGEVAYANVANNVSGSNVSGAVALANVANSVTGANVTGQVANALVAGTVYTNAQPNITSVGNLTNLTVVGNTTLGNQVVSNYFVGNLFGLANLARNVTLSAQPNITSVGTLTSLTVSGNTTLGNATTSNYFIGNLYGVANSAILANTANLANIANTANLANAALIAGTVTTNAQPNITSVGTLSSLSVLGNVTAANFIGNFVGNVSNANYASFAGNVVNASQPNITSVGTLTGLNVSGTLNATGILGPLLTNIQPNITSVGTLSGLTVNGTSNLGNAGNVKILGGNNGYVLSTDGTGNLSWVTQSNGGGGNGTPAGSNTQIQFNNAGSFGASPNLTFNATTNFLHVGANATFAGTANTVTLNSNVVNANTLNVLANITAGNIDGGNLISANFIAGRLTTNTQNNINYLGNLGWLNVDTTIPGGNGNIIFNGSLRGTGLASDINITGNINAADYVEANYFVGELATAAQPNVTSLGTLTSLTVSGVTNLGDVENVVIQGGNANYILSTNGSGNLTWIPQAAANIVPGGLNSYIQFNDNGAFGGDNTLTWNKNTDTLFVGGAVNVSGITNSYIFNSTAPNGIAPITVLSTTPVPNLSVATAGTVRNAAQPNITSVGNLTSLTVTGNISAANLNVTNTFNAGNITTPGTIGTTNLNVTGNGNISGNTVVSGSGTLSINGKFNSAESSNVNLGNIANIHISGGINGYVLATDGNANLYWTAGGGGGGNGNPGGSNTQIQFNNSGIFGGSPAFTFDAPNANVRIAGNLMANSFTMGSGIYEFSRSNVYFATTSDTSTQTLLAIPADDIAAVDYTIISTDGIIRNFIKISAVLCGNSLNYVEYSSLPVNGYTGDFVVAYDGGNIITPPTIQLMVTPQTANLMTHKMSVTTYKE